jgi:5-formyltetrahydrofolate cyclo-ligase
MPSDHHGFIPSSSEDLLRHRVKLELRKRMRGVRGAMAAAACAEKSARIVERLLALEAVRRARSVALFWPLVARREVDLRPADAALRARGTAVAYPALQDDGVLQFRFVDDLAAMEPHALGFMEPPPSATPAAPGQLDAIVVPALAVDPRGHRIGYGAGHYDRSLPAHPSAARIVVAFDFQLVADLPDTEGDVAVGWIVTDVRALEASAAAAIDGADVGKTGAPQSSR